VLDKVVIITRVWDGKGPRPYTLSIPEEENMNKALELEEAEKKIQLNLSNYVVEIAKMNGVSRMEAEKIMQENIKINKQVFEETKEMRETEQDQGQDKTKTQQASKKEGGKK
jgi:hypothetical protein